MKTIAITIKKSAIARAGEDNKLVIVGKEGNHVGEIRGLSNGRVHQLLKTIDVVVDKEHGKGMLVPIVLLQGMKLTANIEVIKAGQKFRYNAEQLANIGEITARRTPESEPEVVKADTDYVAMHDGYRLIDMNNIELEVPTATAMAIANAGRYFNGANVANTVADLAAEEVN